jgi:hypothetical protein
MKVISKVEKVLLAPVLFFLEHPHRIIYLWLAVAIYLHAGETTVKVNCDQSCDGNITMIAKK